MSRVWRELTEIGKEWRDEKAMRGRRGLLDDKDEELWPIGKAVVLLVMKCVEQRSIKKGVMLLFQRDVELRSINEGVVLLDVELQPIREGVVLLVQRSVEARPGNKDSEHLLPRDTHLSG